MLKPVKKALAIPLLCLPCACRWYNGRVGNGHVDRCKRAYVPALLSWFEVSMIKRASY